MIAPVNAPSSSLSVPEDQTKADALEVQMDLARSIVEDTEDWLVAGVQAVMSDRRASRQLALDVRAIEGIRARTEKVKETMQVWAESLVTATDDAGKLIAETGLRKCRRALASALASLDPDDLSQDSIEEAATVAQAICDAMVDTAHRRSNGEVFVEGHWRGPKNGNGKQKHLASN